MALNQILKHLLLCKKNFGETLLKLKPHDKHGHDVIRQNEVCSPPRSIHGTHSDSVGLNDSDLYCISIQYVDGFRLASKNIMWDVMWY